jgi:hypothetical protein
MAQIVRPLRWLVHRLRHSDHRERALLTEAAVGHTIAWLAVRCVPFRWWAHWLGPMHGETPAVERPEHADASRDVQWAIERSKNWAPWEVTCLMEGVAAKMMLARRGIPSTLYLGVTSQAEENPLKAHAWLRCGARIITGAEGRERFTVVSTFGSRHA